MEIGHKLKDIKLIIDDKTVLTEKDLLGKKVIIYFYPKDDTPGCTTEAIDFTSFKNEFDNLEVKLASDEDGSVCRAFKVWVEKSMYGKKYMGIERSTFLFDENLMLIHLWKKVKVKNHVQEVFDYISNLS